MTDVHTGTERRFDMSKIAHGVEAAIGETTKPRHRELLENYRRHMMWEVAGRYDLFVDGAGEMVDNPTYRFYGGAPDDGILVGREAIRSFYEGLLAAGVTVMFAENERIAVADWGFASELLLHHFTPGQILAGMGEQVDDPSATYLLSMQTCMSWPYDPDGLLIGEHVYQDWAGRQITKLAPHEVVTPQEAQEIILPLV